MLLYKHFQSTFELSVQHKFDIRNHSIMLFNFAAVFTYEEINHIFIIWTYNKFNGLQ